MRSDTAIDKVLEEMRYHLELVYGIGFNDGMKYVNQAGQKNVIQYDLNGKYIREYEGIRDAARKTGFSRSSISDCLNPKRKHKTAGGYKWKYKTI